MCYYYVETNFFLRILQFPKGKNLVLLFVASYSSYK